MKKIIWLFLSSFGIMFAVLSWLQESGFLPSDLGSAKGFLAIIFGTILYFFIPSKIS
ncbi:MAG: hypothetical protein ACJZ15_01465 [Candidatus Neomarinimicrobiota bacterium]|tara:strand:+ start:3558 stop:3728 length:171 start_codon:yes stop_codon:yes gene_type:complete